MGLKWKAFWITNFSKKLFKQPKLNVSENAETVVWSVMWNRLINILTNSLRNTFKGVYFLSWTVHSQVFFKEFLKNLSNLFKDTYRLSGQKIWLKNLTLHLVSVFWLRKFQELCAKSFGDWGHRLMPQKLLICRLPLSPPGPQPSKLKLPLPGCG